MAYQEPVAVGNLTPDGDPGEVPMIKPPVLIIGVTVAQQDDWTTTITTSGTYGRAELNGKVVLVDSTSGNVVIFLDPVADWQEGDHFFLAKSVAANSVTINPHGSELISGQATLVLNGLGDSVEVKCNGSAFWAF